MAPAERPADAPALDEWLRDNGLAAFADGFGEGPVDAAALADLGDGDLAALGMGRADRLRFRRAVSQRLVEESAAMPAAGDGALPRAHG